MELRTVIRNISFVCLVVAACLALQTGVLASWGENGQSIAGDYECTFHQPYVEEGPPEVMNDYWITACHNDDTGACIEDEWMDLDLAWACEADCGYNGGQYWGEDHYEGACDRWCECHSS
jgi:hypothetical protein